MKKWEPDLCKKHYLYGYIDGYNAARKGYGGTLSEAYARLSEVAGWLSEHGNIDLPKVSIYGAGNEEGQEMSGTVYKVMEEMEYKFEIGAIIALLRKLLMATQDDNIAHRKHIGVLVEDVLNFLIDAMVESLKKEEQDDEK